MGGGDPTSVTEKLGVMFISSMIDGTVYSKIITPAGSKLPLDCEQMLVNPAEFVQ
jgi:hypothetical protein